MKLVVGLGNPGDRYRVTRHNVGAMVVDALASRHRANLSPHRFGVESARVALGRDGALLAKPLTYMNECGPAIRAALEHFDLKTADLVVVVDDVALPFGRIRIRPGGGDGGHNGLRSIIDALGTVAFWRLRIGIGHPGDPEAVTDYVLRGFKRSEMKALEDVIIRALDAVETMLTQGVQGAMNEFNRREPEGSGLED